MITYHHIGGRNGTYPMPINNTPFTQDTHLILYDADPNCQETMAQTQHHNFKKTTILPYCIGSNTETGYLNINFHPTTNSLYTFNTDFDDYHAMLNPIYGAYRWGDAAKKVDCIPVTLLSLKDALKKAHIDDPMDFLSLDVQGAEYDVLMGAKDLIKNYCLGLCLEVEFVELYKNQKSFADVHQLMERLGFQLLDLSTKNRYTPCSAIGFHGYEQPLYGEMIYIKHPRLWSTHDANYLYKLALFALIHGKVGLCLKALAMVALLPPIIDSDMHYIICLQKIWHLYQEERSCKYPSLSELFSGEMLAGYYRGIPNDAEQFMSDNQRIKNHMAKNYGPFEAKLKNLASIKSTPFESLLQTYGMQDVANIVKKNRLNESANLLTLIARYKPQTRKANTILNCK